MDTPMWNSKYRELVQERNPPIILYMLADIIDFTWNGTWTGSQEHQYDLSSSWYCCHLFEERHKAPVPSNKALKMFMIFFQFGFSSEHLSPEKMGLLKIGSQYSKIPIKYREFSKHSPHQSSGVEAYKSVKRKHRTGNIKRRAVVFAN